MSEHEWVEARRTPSVGPVFGAVIVATGIGLMVGASVADTPQPMVFAAASTGLVALGLLVAVRGLRRLSRQRRARAEGVEVEALITARRRTNTKVGGTGESSGYLWDHTLVSGSQVFSVRAHPLGAEGTAVRLRYLPGHEDEAVVVAVQRPVAAAPSAEQRAAWDAIEARSGGKITISSQAPRD